MIDHGIQVYIRDIDRSIIGSTSTWASLSVVARRNDVGQWTLVIASPEDAALLTPVINSQGKITRNRGIVLRRENVNGIPATFMSGWLAQEPEIEHSGGETVWTFTGFDDTHLMRRTLCWPKPSAAVTAQTDTHDIRSGPASDRIRGYFNANTVVRVDSAGNGGAVLGLGPSAITQARFKGLLELSQEIAGRAVNFKVMQRDSDRALYLYQWAPADKRLDVQFSPALGTVQSWSATSKDSTGNTVITGAGGEMELRVFRRYADANDITAWGVYEVFKDRRDISPTDPNLEDVLAVDGLEFLEENVARSSFTANISSAPDARPFVHYAPGDLVRRYIDQDANGQPIGLVDDLIETVEASWSAEGETGSIQIGAPMENLDELMARQLRLAMRRITDLETRR
ncbi:MAG TPA: hypothetical protein VK735_39655 [Pseudonocardia sp.]|uniref:Gp37-like protein n=1 Tax=Pseudonocardia sp. TaxID=60912 RepID=UPI002B78DEB3|nr:hypothetical protein [Pseudonocardia sp.]HTF53599.1 hypothetical protein [Pseudonocardia sp.]